MNIDIKTYQTIHRQIIDRAPIIAKMMRKVNPDFEYVTRFFPTTDGSEIWCSGSRCCRGEWIDIELYIPIEFFNATDEEIKQAINNMPKEEGKTPKCEIVDKVLEYLRTATPEQLEEDRQEMIQCGSIPKK